MARLLQVLLRAKPWDRALSFYWWRRRRDPELTFDELLSSPTIQDLRRTGLDIYTIDGEIAVDRVCRYEALEDELGSVADHLGVALDGGQLPRAKSGHRTDQRPYQDIYTDRQRERVAELFATEIELFGYQF